MPQPDARPAARVAFVPADRPLEAIDLAAAPEWDVVVTVADVPVGRVRFPSPGGRSERLLESLVLRPVAWQVLEAEAGAAPAGGVLARETSVVVCTHRRPRHLPDALGALAALDPPPLEVVVVDNDPGPDDCRALVEACGFRYVREDRRGADRARNAGVRAARGRFLAFTDDDCEPAPGWLRALDRAFADPAVAAVTGPGFPAALDTRAQVRVEAQASFDRGLVRRVFDRATLPPAKAGVAGASANLVCRGDVLRAVDEPWPVELGPGTPTRSGDDTYLLSRLLIAGWRIVYDPAQWIRHHHRADWEAAHAMFRGYGTGLAATLTKLLVDDRYRGSLAGWPWLARQYLGTQRRRARGRADAVEVGFAWEYVRGALAGPVAWGRARATTPGAGPLRFPPAPNAGPVPPQPVLPRPATGRFPLPAAPGPLPGVWAHARPGVGLSASFWAAVEPALDAPGISVVAARPAVGWAVPGALRVIRGLRDAGRVDVLVSRSPAPPRPGDELVAVLDAPGITASPSLRRR